MFSHTQRPASNKLRIADKVAVSDSSQVVSSHENDSKIYSAGWIND